MNADIEVILLTGGASRRMGTDKSQLKVNGLSMSERIIQSCVAKDFPITVLGKTPISGAAFLMDQQEFKGPLSAISHFTPVHKWVMVLSCDLPNFDAKLITALHQVVGSSEAAIPQIHNRLQPLCGLYRSETFARAKELFHSGESRIMRWVDQLNIVRVDPSVWTRLGLAEGCVKGANTLAEFADAIRSTTSTDDEPFS